MKSLLALQQAGVTIEFEVTLVKINIFIKNVTVRKSNRNRFKQFVFENQTTFDSNISCSKTKPLFIQTFRVEYINRFDTNISPIGFHTF